MSEDDGNGYRAALYVVAIVGAVLTASVLAPVAWNTVQDTGETDEQQVSTVTVLTLRGGTGSANVNAIGEQLREARNNETVEAVVIRIDSSGGPVSSSEELYLHVNRTAREKPVVAYVEGAAASGGYFGISPVDEIFVKPSSSVGSIGVIVSAPLSAVERAEEQREVFLRTGPDKAQISKDGLREDLETLQNAFVGTVMRHRGDELTLSRQQVANGSIYLGTQAVQNGFADRIGGLEAAISAAADRANLEPGSYDVTYREQPQFGLASLFARAEVERVNGSIVYIDRGEASETGTEFVQPVRYYAVWGVPADAVEPTDPGPDASSGTAGDATPTGEVIGDGN